MKLTMKLGWLLPVGLIALLGSVVYFVFLFSPATESSGVAASLCITKCQESLIKGADTIAGPCISDEIQKDWVCDMAHKPRQAVDDLPENQCSAFREGRAKHFVEVDENCKVIQVY